MSGPTLLGPPPRALKGLRPGPQARGLGPHPPVSGEKKRVFTRNHPTRPPRSAEGLGLAMKSRITGANTGQWVRLFFDLARNEKRTTKNAFLLARTITTPEASTGQWVILVTLEADQDEAYQSSYGGWSPGSRGLGPRAWGPGPPQPKTSQFCPFGQPPGRRQAKGWETAETAAAKVGAWREEGTGYHPYPPNPPPTFPGCKALMTGIQGIVVSIFLLHYPSVTPI